ncbi:AGAP009340-PA, partial [Anopheles gambiae str. PEST]
MTLNDENGASSNNVVVTAASGTGLSAAGTGSDRPAPAGTQPVGLGGGGATTGQATGPNGGIGAPINSSANNNN